MELCEVNSDSPEAAGIISFVHGPAGHKQACDCPACLLLSFVHNLLGVLALEEWWRIVKACSTLKTLVDSLLGSL